MSSPDCIVCFCPCGDKIFSCADPRCAATICLDCIQGLIEHSNTLKIIPSCVGQGCQAYFLLSQIKGVPATTIQLYQQACLDFMIQDKGEQVQKKLQQEAIIQKLREERMKFIQASFPAAVALVSQLTFGTKLRRLEKQRKTIVQKQVNTATKRCCLITCNGFLDKDYECMTCTTRFCNQCEAKLKEGHVCKEEDIQSLQAINQMVRCPNPTCRLPIVRSSGCDSISCASCQTKFLYSTGKEGGHGSSNAKINVAATLERQKLTEMYTMDAEILYYIYQLEALEPPTITQDTLNPPIKMYYETHDAPYSARQLAKRLDAYVQNRYQRQIYRKHMTEVETMLQEKTATPEELKSILQAVRGIPNMPNLPKQYAPPSPMAEQPAADQPAVKAKKPKTKFGKK